MYQKERIESITEILKKNGYVTVKYLSEELHYSTATINRDLNYMQKKKLIKRSYGGVELTKIKTIPLVFRYNKMRVAKNLIGKAAAKLICDGDVVFFDSSTTTQYISKYITEKKKLTIITTNIALASFLSEYGIKVILTGGHIIDAPYILGGEETVEAAMKYKTDKFFFSSGAVTPEGLIPEEGYRTLFLKAAIGNSEKSYFLADHDKIADKSHIEASKLISTLDMVTDIITDFSFSDVIKSKYPKTNFIEVGTEEK